MKYNKKNKCPESVKGANAVKILKSCDRHCTWGKQLKISKKIYEVYNRFL